MVQPFLSSKLFIPPARHDLVSRRRLVERLQEGLSHPLTLVTAPAGYGKTTLIGEWRLSPVGKTYPLAWLSLDEDDNDLRRFLGYLAEALRRVNAEAVEQFRELLTSPQPPGRRLLDELIGAVEAIPGPFAVALDDYHAITRREVHEAVTYLLDHQPVDMHMVILTRSDPPLPLARLRARDQLTEIRLEQLRFTQDEAAVFLRQAAGLALSKDVLAALDARVEGWAAGLQLVAAALQTRQAGGPRAASTLPEGDVEEFISAFTGSQRYVMDYLTDEVLERQPEEVRNFLLQTSILERMNAELCESILRDRGDGIGEKGQPKPAEGLLDTLDRSNLFLIPLDDERNWYRYHALFADVLQNRLNRSAPQRVRELHQRAGEWFERHGFLSEAFNHSLAGGDADAAADLVERQAAGLLSRGEMRLLIGWLKRLEPFHLRRAWLCVYQAWALAFTGQFGPLEELLKEAGGCAEVQGETTDRDIAGELEALRAYWMAVRGEAEAAVQHAQRALQLLPPENLVVRGVVNLSMAGALWFSGNLAGAAGAFEQASKLGQMTGSLHLTISALCGQANLHMLHGKLHLAQRVYQEAAHAASGLPGKPPAVAAEAWTGLGLLEYEWNHLEEAAIFLEGGLASSQLLGRAGTVTAARVALSRLRLARRDWEGVHKLLEEAANSAQSSLLNPAVDAALRAQSILMWLWKGDLDMAQQTAEEGGLQRLTELNLTRCAEYTAYARLLVALGKTSEALHLLEELKRGVQAEGRVGQLIDILLVQSTAQRMRREDLAWRETREQAHVLGKAEGYQRIYLDDAELLAKVLPAAPGAERLAETLSERELEVLRLVVEGKSNGEIARQLVIAPGTVKKHLSNIFGKLGAQNRTECAAVARKMGLL